MEVTKVLYMLWVSDMDKSIGFYRDVIGLDVKVQSPGWSELAFGNATVALHLGRDEKYRMTGLNFEVSNIEDACDELACSGRDSDTRTIRWRCTRFAPSRCGRY